MGRIKQFITRRMIMAKLKAFFRGLLQPGTSEFWMGWGGLVIKGLGLALPAAIPVITTVAQFVGLDSPDMLAGALLTYAFGRMTSKAVKQKGEL